MSKRGDVWALGRHRLMCGDSTVAAAVERLLGGAKVDSILTDPPYSSGGFQESGRSAGSKGTDVAYTPIQSDRLSTRGYQALIKGTLALVPVSVVYVFTDWRMWVNLFDVVESSGYGVRSMIVWNKGSRAWGRAGVLSTSLSCAGRGKTVCGTSTNTWVLRATSSR